MLPVTDNGFENERTAIPVTREDSALSDSEPSSGRDRRFRHFGSEESTNKTKTNPSISGRHSLGRTSYSLTILYTGEM